MPDGQSDIRIFLIRYLGFFCLNILFVRGTEKENKQGERQAGI